MELKNNEGKEHIMAFGSIRTSVFRMVRLSTSLGADFPHRQRKSCRLIFIIAVDAEIC